MDKQAILEELRAYREQQAVPKDERQEGDLTYHDIETEFGIRRCAARAMMEKLIEAGRFIRVQIPTNHGGRLTCFRRVENKPPAE